MSSGKRGKSLSIIVAMDQRGLIGRKGDLPWRLPNDLKHFKRLTIGKTILMGRKTWDSLPGALPGRQSWVISRKPDFKAEGAHRFTSLEQAMSAHQDGELMVIGGAQLYRQTLPNVQRIYLTKVLTTIEGSGENEDVYFPEFNAAEFSVSAQENHPADERHAHPYRFVTLDRK